MDVDKVIAALRDTAAKGEEAVSIKRIDANGMYGRPQEYEETRERYSREWLIGRIEGLADALEAMKGGA